MLLTKLPLNFRSLTKDERARYFAPGRDLLHPSDEEVERAIRSVPTHRGAACYLVYNSSLATTAAPVKQPTGTAIRTMMQLKMGAGVYARIIEWGYSLDALQAGNVELFETTVAATMSTAYVNADIQRFNNANGPQQGDTTNLPIDVTGTSTSGFATAAVTEGTVANYRGFDLQLVTTNSSNQYWKQFPLGREPELKAGNFLRCRMTFGTTTNAYSYVIFEV